VRYLGAAAATLLLAACGGSGGGAGLDCEQTRKTEIQAPARFGGDPAAIAVWHLEQRGLRETDLVDEAPGDSEAVVIRRDRRVVGKVTVQQNDAEIETCSDFAA
jgi:hypothetical protein